MGSAMGMIGSSRFPKEESFLLPMPREPGSLLDAERFPPTDNAIQTFCVRAGEDVLGSPPMNGLDAPKVLRVYGVNRQGDRLNGFADGNQLVTLVDMSNQLVAAWRTEGNFTTIYSRRPRVAEGSSAADRVPVPVWRGNGTESPQELYPFARVEGGYKEGQENKPFKLYMAAPRRGGGGTAESVFDGAEPAYTATGLGGHFWKITKDSSAAAAIVPAGDAAAGAQQELLAEGPGACLVLPARLHYGSQCSPSGAQAVLVAPGMDPLLFLAVVLIKNMKVIGPLPQGHSGLQFLERMDPYDKDPYAGSAPR